MHLATEVFGDVVVVHAPDELNEEHAVSFSQFLTSQDRLKVVVDLNDVEALDSAGLMALLDAQDACRAAKGDLKLIASHSINRKILDISRLDEQLEVYESVIDAVKSFV
ncbi:MAG: STAS domain-containing protein [Pirellulaceae bacterium]